MDVSVKSLEGNLIVVEHFDRKKKTENWTSGSNTSDGIILPENKSKPCDTSENYPCMLDYDYQEKNSGEIVFDNHQAISCNTTNYSEVCVNEAVCTIETDELLITCAEATETSSNELSKRIGLNSVMKSEKRVNTGGNQLLKIIYEIEMFFDAVNSTNKDMQKKSGILLQKQKLVDEIVSYIHAVQSVNRLSTSRNLVTGNFRKDSVVVYHNKSISKQTSKASKPYYEASKPFYEAAKPFYEAGEKILEELDLYRRELREDFKVWEAYRKEIVEISDQMLDDFEYCEDEMSAKVLMHEISTRICNILRHMEMITSRRKNKNENCIELMDSVDTYIRYSSAFIMSNRTLHYS